MSKIVFLWTGSRCLSTAFERAHYERNDCKIYHEPFGQPYYFGVDKKSNRFEELKNTSYIQVYNDIFNNEPITDKYIFVKDMAYYIDFILNNPLKLFPKFIDSNVKHTFLIRHPQKSIYSLYLKSCIDNKETNWKYFDEIEAGFKSMYKLWKFLDSKNIKTIIVDADYLLENPKHIMNIYCEKIEIPINNNMCYWEKKNISEFDLWPGWHNDVLNSTGIIQKNITNELPNIEKLPDYVKNVIYESIPIYNEMTKHKIC